MAKISKNKSNVKPIGNKTQTKCKKMEIERGPTKKQLREEIAIENKMKKIKNDKKKGKISSEQAEEKKKKLVATKNSGTSESYNKKKTVVNNEKKSTLNKHDRKEKDLNRQNAKKTTKDTFKEKPEMQKKIQTHKDNGSKLNKKHITDENVKAKKVIKKSGKNLSKDNRNKVIYTNENINTFLINAQSSNSKDQAINLLLYIFKNYRSNSAELLSKIKILTSSKKVDTNQMSLPKSIMTHLFAFYDIKGDFYENLFGFISGNSLLSKYACEYYYSNKLEQEEYHENFNQICNELGKVLNRHSFLPFNDYLEYVNEADQLDSLDKLLEMDDKPQEDIQGSKETIVDDSKNTPPDLCPENENSNFSLISLNDDEEISRLDKQLGEYFSNGNISPEDIEYSKSLSLYLKSLILNNYPVDINDLFKLLFFYQFEPLNIAYKGIVKAFIKKFNDTKRLFRIFQISSLVNPSTYSLYSPFFNTCGSDFDHFEFLKSIFAFGHEDIIIKKINKDAFYDVYHSNLGQDFDNFMISLINSEDRREKLVELSQQYHKPEIKIQIEQALAKKNSKLNDLAGDKAQTA